MIRFVCVLALGLSSTAHAAPDCDHLAKMAVMYSNAARIIADIKVEIDKTVDREAKYNSEAVASTQLSLASNELMQEYLSFFEKINSHRECDYLWDN